MADPELEFLFEGMLVGIFKESDYPRAPGRYGYEPYRSFGHYALHTQLAAGGSPRCYYEADGVRVSFTVRDCPEYGVFELCEFESSLPGASLPAEPDPT
jgi:hypothetical protein